MKKLSTYFSLTILLLVAAFTLVAQNDAFGPERFCAAAEMQKAALKKNPQAQQRWQVLEDRAYQVAINPQRTAAADYTLPVVIHIIHDNGSENLTDAMIQQGMEDLNEAFENINYYDQGTGVNTNIEFCLASRAPDGTATSGINRIQNPLTEATPTDDADLKALSVWDPFKYVNIWLVRELCRGANCNLAGYANFPSLHGLPTDGIVMEAKWFGSSQANSTVQIHEMGHYLGLYHTFNGGCSNNDCNFSGDRVCDTPPDNSTAAVPCGGTINTCSTDTDSGFTTDQEDMYWNYMDYGYFECYSAFTQGQADRMAFFINNGRSSLLASDGCDTPCPITADLSIDPAPSQVDVGTTVTFTLTAPTLSQFEWFINNVSVGTGPSLTYTFTDKGTYTISVEGSDGSPLCAAFDFVNVEVTCPVIADFTASATQVFVNESVLFTSTSTNAASLSWFIDGTLVSTATSFTELFNTEGNYEIILVATNPVCSDTTATSYIFVVNPCGEGGTKKLQTPSIRPRQIRKLADGGLMVIYRDPQSNANPPHITRLDNNQDLVWAKIVTTGEPVKIFDVVEDSADDGFLFCGSTEIQGEDRAYVFKLDVNGNYLWGHQSDLDEREFQLIYPASGGDFLVAGNTNVFPPPDSSFIIKIQSDGNILWSKQYLGIRMIDFEPMSDGTMYLSGRIGPYPSSFSSAALAQLDADGNVLQSHRYTDPLLGNGFHTRLSTMVENDDGGVVIAYSNQDPTFKKFDVLVSLDGDGDILWQKKYYFGRQPVSYETEGPVHAFRRTPDGGYVFYSTLTNDLFSVLTKVDAQGELLWSRNLSSSFNLWREYPRIEILDNNNLVVAHYQSLFILDPDGLLGPCQLIDVSSEIYPVNLVKEALDFEHLNTVSFSSLSATISDGVFDPQVSCETPAAMQPDAEVNTIDAGICNNLYTINWQVCNKGTGILPIGTPYTLYDGNPTTMAATVISTQSLSMDLNPNDCRILQTTIPSLPANTVHIIFNDNGTVVSPFHLITDLSVIASPIECNFFNNLDSLSLAGLSPGAAPIPFLGNDTIICSNTSIPLGPGVFSSYLWQNGSTNDSLIASTAGTYSVTVTDACGVTEEDEIVIQKINPPTLNLGPDITLCENAVLPLDAGPGFESYFWSDGSKEQQITAWLDGIYIVEVVDACGDIQRDSIVINIDPGTILDLPLELTACSGSNLTISAPGFLNYQWSPGGILDCDNCPNVIFNVDQDRTFYLLVETTVGCFSSDSIRILVQDTINTFGADSFCSGDSVLVFGQWIKTPGDYSDLFIATNGCDSIHTIQVNELSPVVSGETRNICQGDSSFIFGVWEKTTNSYAQNFINYLGCDSTHTIDLLVVDTLQSSDQLNICVGDSAFIFGIWEKTANVYSQTSTSAAGCDSTHSVTLLVLNPETNSDQLSICRGDSAFIFGNWENTANAYSQTYSNIFGCDSTHTTTLLLLDTLFTTDQLTICDGDSVLIFGVWEKTADLYRQTFSSSFGCDSTHSVDLLVYAAPMTNDQMSICQGDSVLIFGNWETAPNTYTQSFTTSLGCDSTHSVDLLLIDTFLIESQLTICEGDSVLIFGNWESDIRAYSRSYTSSLGCDSIEVILLSNTTTALSTEQQIICSGDSILIFGGWVFNSGTFNASFPVAGACDSIHVIEVIVEDEIMLDATPEVIIAPGDSVVLQVEVLSNLQNGTYDWFPILGLSCSDCINPIAYPMITTNYNLVVTDEQGCTAAIEILVRVEEPERTIYIPTGFSPNADLSNDFLFPQGLTGSAAVLRMAVYDRWGEVVFENTDFELNDPGAGWDGTFKQKTMDPGVFVVVVEVLWENGEVELFSEGVLLWR